MKSLAASTVRRLSACAVGVSLSVACAPTFDPASELQGLRVMAVKKSEPYARPGEDVDLNMLWHDASGESGREIQILWLTGCYNPPGDLFSLCFTPETFGLPGSGDLPSDADLPDAGAAPVANDAGGMGVSAAMDAGGDAGEPAVAREGAPTLSIPISEFQLRGGDFPVKVGYGESFRFNMPERIVSSRPRDQGSNVPPYGIAYVFFAVCAGEVRIEPQAAFPLACYDGNQRLGSRDFVAGYTAVYGYEGATFRNANPRITGLTIDGVRAQLDCIGEGCSGVIPPSSSSDSSGCASTNRLQLCREGVPCPEVKIKPIIDQTQPAENDVVLSEVRGRDFAEQMWINYYVDRGDIKRDLRLLNDAVTGWNEDYGSEYLPTQQGTAYLWAVAHDNRGGTEWLRTELCIVR